MIWPYHTFFIHLWRKILLFPILAQLFLFCFVFVFISEIMEYVSEQNNIFRLFLNLEDLEQGKNLRPFISFNLNFSADSFFLANTLPT